MMKQYFDTLVSGIEASLQDKPEDRSPRKIYALEVARIGQRLYSGDDRVAWCGVLAPFDLLAAMNVNSCFVEFVGAMLATTGVVGEFLEEAEHAGFGPDTCGYHRAVMGAAKRGLMPEPDFLIATTCPCTGGLAVMENLAQHFGKDLFVLNVPQNPTEANVRYLADQIKGMAKFVSDHTGEPLDEERLRQAMEISNRATEEMREVYRLARHVPTPANGHMLGNFGIAIPLLFGREAGVNIAQTYRETFDHRIKNGTPGVSNERFRLMWIQNRIQFKNPLVSVLEKEYGAVIVSDELNAVTWEAIDLEAPYTSLARRAISIPFNGEIARRIKHLQNLAQEYRIDGAINPCHWGCRQGTGSRGLISEGLREIDVPVLNLEVDCVDSRNFAEGQMRTRLEAFIEMLEGRPSPWS